jgi:hypothetical protein
VTIGVKLRDQRHANCNSGNVFIVWRGGPYIRGQQESEPGEQGPQASREIPDRSRCLWWVPEPSTSVMGRQAAVPALDDPYWNGPARVGTPRCRATRTGTGRPDPVQGDPSPPIGRVGWCDVICSCLPICCVSATAAAAEATAASPG